MRRRGLRNLVLILALSLTAFASASAAGMRLDHAGGALPAALASTAGHACPACPGDAMGAPGDPAACGACAACGAVGRDTPQPTAEPVARAGSRLWTLRVACRAASRIETEDPPPPRA